MKEFCRVLNPKNPKLITEYNKKYFIIKYYLEMKFNKQLFQINFLKLLLKKILKLLNKKKRFKNK